MEENRESLVSFLDDVDITNIELSSDEDEIFTDGDGDGEKKVLLGSKGGSFTQSQTNDWNPTITSGSAEEGWLHKLRKLECNRFVSTEGSRKCHCGREKDEHRAIIEEVDGDLPWQKKSCIVTQKSDAVGKFEFKDDSMQSMFFRLDFSTRGDQMCFLLHKILNLSRYSVYIHFLDFEEKPSDIDEAVKEKLESGLESGLRTLAKKTKLMISSTGLKTGLSGHINNVLAKLTLDRDPTFHTEVFRLACLPWGCLTREDREHLTGEIMHVIRPGTREQEAQDESSPLFKERLSPFFSHYLMFDDGFIYETLEDANYKNAKSFRKRIEKQLAAFCENAVSVFVMMNGGPQMLDHVFKAVNRGVPVIIIKGTGGFADILAKNYLNAEEVVRKYMATSTKFLVRYELQFAKDLEDVEEEYVDKVRKILDNNHLLTVFDPMFRPQGLDMVICQALLKGRQEDKLNHLLQTFLDKCLQGDRTEKDSLQDCFLGSESLQMDLLIEAMLNDSSDVIDKILEGSLNLYQHFNMERLSQLYCREQSLGTCLPLLREANLKNSKKLGVSEGDFGPLDVRSVLRRLLRASYPLGCEGKDCQCLLKGKHVRELDYAPYMFRTCLPPIQEMFLWALLTNHQRQAMVFWKYSEDKLASALLAEMLLSCLAEREGNTDRQFKLVENAKEFEDLAVDVLHVCYELNEQLTHELLMKKSSWWGDQSVMELAYSFRSRRFLSQPACKSLLDTIWKGKLTAQEPWLTVQVSLATIPGIVIVPILDIGTEEAKGFSIQETKPHKCCPGLKDFYSAPMVKYYMNVVLFVVFLGVFSYVLLVDLQPKFTLLQGILCVWVATYLGEEIRQILSIKGRTSYKEKWKYYWAEGWNKLDVIIIILFTVGMVLGVSEHQAAYQTRRIFLSVDFILFSMRLLQAFAVGQEIGPMLTMIHKMIRDTVTFVIIMFVFILSYAVASESILFPQAHVDPQMLYSVPRKAYWQIYGDFFLEDIEGKDAECTNNPALYHNRTIDRCPSHVGQYAVPVLLAVYCIITHVLLLNLLIAKFNDTYARVQGEAKIHWAWYRCQIFHEFAHRPSLPPPLNAFSCLLWVLKKIFHFLKKLVCCYYCSKWCRNKCAASTSCSAMLLRNYNDRVTVDNVGTTTAKISWRDPNDVQATRHRLYCYIVTGANKIIDPGKPNMVVTLYAMESYVVKHLKSDTSYKIRIKYEADANWFDLGETELNTLLKAEDKPADHEARCVRERESVQEEDPVVSRLDQVHKTVSSNKQDIRASFQQVNGDISQLTKKVEDLDINSTEIVKSKMETSLQELFKRQLEHKETKTTNQNKDILAKIEALKAELVADRETHQTEVKNLQSQIQTQAAMLEKILTAVAKGDNL